MESSAINIAILTAYSVGSLLGTPEEDVGHYPAVDSASTQAKPSWVKALAIGKELA